SAVSRPSPANSSTSPSRGCVVPELPVQCGSATDVRMKHQLHAVVMLAIVGLVCAPRPARAQSFKVGTFNKPAATGAQTVAHNLGVAPSALILWTGGRVTENSGTGSYWWAFGVTDGTTSRSTSASSLGAVSSEN